MRIGVAGTGRIGAMHAANLVGLADEVLLYDPVPGRAETIAAKLGTSVSAVSAVSTVDTLLTDCDGLVVATPTSSHGGLVRAATAAGLPVLCEKPLADNLSAMRQLVTEVDTAGATVLVGFHRRFDPATVELRRRLRSGEAGTVYLVRTVCHDAAPPPPEYIAGSGGLFRDCLIHDLDAVPWLVGEPVVWVHATGSVLVDRMFAAAGDVDTAVVTLRFAGGAHAVLSAARHDPAGYDCRTEVFASKETLAVGDDPRTPLTSLEPDGRRCAADAYTGFDQRYRKAYVNELRVFIEVIAGRAENPSPARESLYSLRLADACEESVRSGESVCIR